MRRLFAKIHRRLFRPAVILHGYEQAELIDVIFRKTLAFEPHSHWPEMRGVASVLDFGGGFGVHYKQANSPTIRWAVVETPAIVRRAKEIASERLQFFVDVAAARDWLREVDVMHSNGAIQYTRDPIQTLKELCSVSAKRMIWRRLFLSDIKREETQSSFLGDNGPGALEIVEKTVQYQRTSVSEREFLSAHNNYILEDRGRDWFRFQITRMM